MIEKSLNMPVFGDSTVSVCMPVYNGSELIEESIRSILSQTYANFNLIVCDNCSSDNTEEIVRSFDDSRIFFSRNDRNLGLVGNANRCLELANGDYVNILHHDDLMLPHNLERKVRVLDEYSSVGIVHSNVGYIDQKGHELDINMFDADKDYLENGKVYFEKYIMRMPLGAAFFIGAVMVRRECYLRLGGFNPELLNVNDSEMWMRILLFFDVACIGERLVKYRLHDTMTSTAINDEHGLNIDGLEEHLMGCNIVLNQYADRIFNRREIKKKLVTAFAIRSTIQGIRSLRSGNITQCAAYLLAAHRFDPLIFLRSEFKNLLKSLLVKNIKKWPQYNTLH
jgi:glycosyltransferase involved in cell wall biosynthesis